MSTLSHTNSKKGLDVLEHQDVHIEKESSYKVHINKIHDFSEVKVKPTELDPSVADKPRNPQVSPYVKVEEFVKNKPKGDSEFMARMREIRSYIRGLTDIKKIKVLEFDLSGFDTEEDYDAVVTIINHAAEKEVISQKEKADILNVLRGFPLKTESVEDSGLSLEDARKEYAEHYIEWERKSRTAKKMFLKALADLGVSKPVPERISQKSAELTEAIRDYMTARNKKAIGLSEEAALEFIIKEKELVEELVNSNREEKEKGRLEKAIKTWEKLPQDPSTHRALLAHAVLSDGANFSTVFSGLASATSGFVGFRAPRDNKSDIKAEVMLNQAEEKKADKYISIGKNFRIIGGDSESAPSKGINEDAVRKKEDAMRSVALNQTDTKKKDRLVKASKLIGVEYREETSATPKKGILGGFARALGLDSVVAKPAPIPLKAEEKKLPKLKVAIPLLHHDIETSKKPDVENIEPVSTPKITAAGQIPYMETYIDIVDTGVARKILVNSIEIAAEVPCGNGTIFALYDKFQDGGDFKAIRDAYSVAVQSSCNLQNVAKQSTIVDFEGGKIYIFAGFSDDPFGIKVLLNGKEIAKGVYKGSAHVALLDAPEIKSGWLLSDTVYERAFKKAEPALKNITIL